MFGARGAKGVIAIYSANNSLHNKYIPEKEKLKDFERINILVINNPKIFVQNLKNQTTLFWNPIIFPDEKGEASIKICTKYKWGHYLIQALGFNKNGKIMIAQKMLQIKENN